MKTNHFVYLSCFIIAFIAVTAPAAATDITQIDVYHEEYPDKKLFDADVITSADYLKITLFGSDGGVQQINISNGDLPVSVDGDLSEPIVVEVGDNQGSWCNGSCQPVRRPTIYPIESSGTVDLFVITRDSALGDIKVNDVTFQIDDFTGEYSDEPQIYLERYLNRTTSPGKKYYNITGDYASSSGKLETFLHRHSRYRITIKNNDNDTRVLGPYTPRGDAIETLEVGRLQFDQLNDSGYKANASITKFDDGTGRIIFTYQDPEEQSTNLNIEIYERYNKSNVRFSDSDSGPLGTYQASIILDEKNASKSWNLHYSADRNGSEISATRPIGFADYPLGIPLDPFWKHVFSSALIVFFGAIVAGTQDTPKGAFTMVGFAGMFYYINWLPTEVGAGVIVFAFVTATVWWLGGDRP